MKKIVEKTNTGIISYVEIEKNVCWALGVCQGYTNGYEIQVHTQTGKINIRDFPEEKLSTVKKVSDCIEYDFCQN